LLPRIDANGVCAVRICTLVILSREPVNQTFLITAANLRDHLSTRTTSLWIFTQQVMGGRYAERSIWGERRKHRRSEETTSSGGLPEMRNGVGHPDGMTTMSRLWIAQSSGDVGFLFYLSFWEDRCVYMRRPPPRWRTPSAESTSTSTSSLEFPTAARISPSIVPKCWVGV
jgi:hypothetical protein